MAIHGPFRMVGITDGTCEYCGLDNEVHEVLAGDGKLYRWCQTCIPLIVKGCAEGKAKPAAKSPKPKNLCAKTVKRENAYEVWQAGDWTWHVLKKYQADDHKPYARWFCSVVTPICPNGELGDVFAADVMKYARRVK